MTYYSTDTACFINSNMIVLKIKKLSHQIVVVERDDTELITLYEHILTDFEAEWCQLLFSQGYILFFYGSSKSTKINIYDWRLNLKMKKTGIAKHGRIRPIVF